MSEVKGSDRVSIEDATHQVYQDLSERSAKNAEASPFFLMKDVFMWSVALGVKAGKRRALSGNKREIFRWDQFSQDLDVPSLKIIALVAAGDAEILLHDDDILRIAEEYANEGIRELRQLLMDQPAKALWNLVDIIRS